MTDGASVAQNCEIRVTISPLAPRCVVWKTFIDVANKEFFGDTQIAVAPGYPAKYDRVEIWIPEMRKRIDTWDPNANQYDQILRDVFQKKTAKGSISWKTNNYSKRDIVALVVDDDFMDDLMAYKERQEESLIFTPEPI